MYWGSKVRNVTASAEASAAGSTQVVLGYAHRRARVFMFWWTGMMFAIPGAAYAAALAATGQSPGDGLALAGLGLGLSGVGWLAAIGPRFTRSDPKPADDLARTEQNIRINPGVAIGLVAVMLLMVIVLMVATPRGTSPEALPVLAALGAFPIPIAAALLYSTHLHRDREGLYAKWLVRR